MMIYVMYINIAHENRSCFLLVGIIWRRAAWCVVEGEPLVAGEGE